MRKYLTEFGYVRNSFSLPLLLPLQAEVEVQNHSRTSSQVSILWTFKFSYNSKKQAWVVLLQNVLSSCINFCAFVLKALASRQKTKMAESQIFCKRKTRVPESLVFSRKHTSTIHRNEISNTKNPLYNISITHIISIGQKSKAIWNWHATILFTECPFFILSWIT